MGRYVGTLEVVLLLELSESELERLLVLGDSERECGPINGSMVPVMTDFVVSLLEWP